MKSIDVIAIPVTNQQDSKIFYMKLGFELLEETRMDQNKWWIKLGLEGSPITITLVNWFSKMPAGSMQGLVLRTDNLMEEIQNLETHGIKTSKVEEAPLGKFVSFKDPDGNGLSFLER